MKATVINPAGKKRPTRSAIPKRPAEIRKAKKFLKELENSDRIFKAMKKYKHNPKKKISLTDKSNMQQAHKFISAILERLEGGNRPVNVYFTFNDRRWLLYILKKL